MFKIEYRIVGKHRKWRKVAGSWPYAISPNAADALRNRIADNARVAWHQVKLRQVKDETL